MTSRSQLYRLIEERLEGTLSEYMAANRAQMSWRAMSDDLYARTGIRVSYQTLRVWFDHRITIKTEVQVAA